MSKTNIDRSGDGFILNTAPGNFELDEIEWDETEYPVKSDSIPFKNTTKKISKELEHD